MKRSQISGVLFGATALALVGASTAIAQQNTGQDKTEDTTQQQTTQQGSQQSGQQQGAQGGQQQGSQQQSGQQAQGGQQQGGQQTQQAGKGGQQDEQAMQIQQQLQQAGEALEQNDTEQAQQALQQADQQVRDAMQQGAEQQQHKMSELQQGIQEATEALGRQDVEGAQAALNEARTKLQEIRAASAEQEGGQQQGDVTATVVPSDQQGEQAQQEATTGQGTTAEVTPLSEEETRRLLGTGDRELGEATEVLTLTPADLEDRDVVTMDGEEVGSVDQVVSSGGQFYAIIEHGGFLGIGEDQVAIPLERIGMRGEEVILLGLTEEQLEAMPEYDFAADEDVANEQSIEIGRYE